MTAPRPLDPKLSGIARRGPSKHQSVPLPGLRQLREARGLTRGELGLKVWPSEARGTAKSRIQNLEAGNYSAAKLAAVARFLRVTTTRLEQPDDEAGQLRRLKARVAGLVAQTQALVSQTGSDPWEPVFWAMFEADDAPANLARALGVEWADPGASYEDDVQAFASAVENFEIEVAQ